MDIVTRHNLDEVFYGILEAPNVIKLFVINNVLTSAVGHKIIYELKNVKTGSTMTMTEAGLETALDDKALVRNIEDVQNILNNRVKDCIEDLEKLKRDFLKEKLNRTLNHNERKAQNSIESIKKKVGIESNTNEEEIWPSGKASCGGSASVKSLFYTAKNKI